MKLKHINIKRLTFNVFMLIAVSVIISFVLSGPVLFSSWNRFIKTASYGILIGGAFWTFNSILGNYTGKKLDWSKNPRKASMITFWAYIFTGAALSLIVPYFYFKFVFHVRSEDLYDVVITNSFIVFAIDLVFVSYYYSLDQVKYLIASMRNEEKLERENLIARYETLKNQVNPHFLFNSLNTLSGIVEKNGNKAVDYIKKLSDIYRYVLEQKDKELISVNKELEFVHDFIYLEKSRHGKALDFHENIRSKNAFVAPLAIQMLVENAIKHNIISDEHPLFIELFEQYGYFIIKNNFQKRKVVKKQQPVGLDNLIKRYAFLSERKVIIEETDSHFVVKLPVIQSLST